MTVLMQAKVSGIDEAVYKQMTGGDFFDRLNRFEGYGGWHAAGPTDGGWQVFETWDSAEAHQKWFQTNIAPNMPPEMAPHVDVKYHELFS